jgi:hypothetical protein
VHLCRYRQPNDARDGCAAFKRLGWVWERLLNTRKSYISVPPVSTLLFHFLFYAPYRKYPGGLRSFVILDTFKYYPFSRDTRSAFEPVILLLLCLLFRIQARIFLFISCIELPSAAVYLWDSLRSLALPRGLVLDRLGHTLQLEDSKEI